MILKLNSISDRYMIKKLYDASQAGVKIKIIARGICSLVPGIKDFSDNIEVISIVDRFLEHARIFIFNNNGHEEIYLSSADWMTRNLSHRVETAFPVYNPKFKEIIKHVIDYQLMDNVKSRTINAEQDNSYRRDDNDLAVRAQIETYYYFKRLEAGTV